jgi:hypothetical protein
MAQSVSGKPHPKTPACGRPRPKPTPPQQAPCQTPPLPPPYSPPPTPRTSWVPHPPRRAALRPTRRATTQVETATTTTRTTMADITTTGPSRNKGIFRFFLALLLSLLPPLSVPLAALRSTRRNSHLTCRTIRYCLEKLVGGKKDGHPKSGKSL